MQFYKDVNEYILLFYLLLCHKFLHLDFENILSSSVRTDNIRIDDTATIENINMYRDEFMSGYDTVNPIEPITLSITDADLSSKDAIIEKIAEQVREYEMHRME